MNDKIKDENLLRVIKLKLCAIPSNDYKEIEDISIVNKNFLGNILNIDLTEIVKLEKLKSISLKFFEITDEIIDSLNDLKELYKIEFYMCKFNSNKKLNKNIKDITIYNCNEFDIELLKDSVNVEKLELTHSGLVNIDEIQIYKNLKILKIGNCSVISLSNLSKLEKLEEIYLNNIDIQNIFDISNMKKLRFISLNGSNIIDKDNIVKRLKEQNSNVMIECNKNALPVE